MDRRIRGDLTKEICWAQAERPSSYRRPVSKLIASFLELVREKN